MKLSISVAQDKPEANFKTLNAWKSAVAKLGYDLEKKQNPRLGEFWIASYKGSVAGSFCAKHAKDSFLLPPTDKKFSDT